MGERKSGGGTEWGEIEWKVDKVGGRQSGGGTEWG